MQTHGADWQKNRLFIWRFFFFHITSYITPHHISHHVTSHTTPHHISNHVTAHTSHHTTYHTTSHTTPHHISHHSTSHHIISRHITYHITPHHITNHITSHTISHTSYHVTYITSHTTSHHIPHHITSHHSVPPLGLLRKQRALPVTRYVFTCLWSYLSLVYKLCRRGHITHPLFCGGVCLRLWMINCLQITDHATSRTASPAQSN